MEDVPSSGGGGLEFGWRVLCVTGHAAAMEEPRIGGKREKGMKLQLTFVHVLTLGTICCLWLSAGRAAAQCNAVTIPATPVAVMAGDWASCDGVEVTWEQPGQSVSGVTYRVWRYRGNDLDSLEMIVDRHPARVYLDESAPEQEVLGYFVQALDVNFCSSGLSAGDDGIRRPARPSLLGQPGDVTVDEGLPAVFEVRALFASSVRWRRDGVALSDDGVVAGAGTSRLTITSAGAEHVGYYDAVVANDCGLIETEEAALAVGGVVPCFGCVADYDGSGGVDAADVEGFFIEWTMGASCADVNRDGGVDGSDVDGFVVAWAGGEC